MPGSGWTEAILDRAHNAVISLDEAGQVTYWNTSAERIFGLTTEDALGRPVAELIIPHRYRDAHKAGIQRFLADGIGPMLDRRVEMAALRADGSEFPVEMTITTVRDGSSWTFVAFVADVSERVNGELERERLVARMQEALRDSELRFETVVGSLDEAVTIRSRDHQLVYANQAALSYLGFESVEQLRATTPNEIMADYRVFAADGRDVSMADIPSVKILNGGAADPLLIRVVHRESGEERWKLLKAAPLTEDGGDAYATIMLIEDVTEQRRAERDATFLARASEVLASSLDYEVTLQHVAELAVPDIVDWCAVDLIDDSGQRQSVAVAHTNPERLRLAEELRRYETALDPNEGLGWVLRTGEPLLYPEIPDELLLRAAVDERHLELIRAVGLRSGAVVPMKLGERTLGALTLVSAESGRVLNESDLMLAAQLAARAATAIENSRLYSQRTQIAHTLQQSLLPRQLPEIPGYELAGAYVPADAEVGGDFYDAWPINDGWLIAIGDVTGKGVDAAALTALARHTLRTASEFLDTPAQLLSHLNQTLRSDRDAALCTAICLRVDPTGNRLALSIAGHPLPVCVSDADTDAIGAPGPILGAFEEGVWEDSVVSLAPGETVLLYTDGVTDTVGADRIRFGLDRLHAQVATGPRSAAQLITALRTALRDFQVGAQADDTAMLALHRVDGS